MMSGTHNKRPSMVRASPGMLRATQGMVRATLEMTVDADLAKCVIFGRMQVWSLVDVACARQAYEGLGFKAI